MIIAVESYRAKREREERKEKQRVRVLATSTVTPFFTTKQNLFREKRAQTRNGKSTLFTQSTESKAKGREKGKRGNDDI